MAFGRKVMRGVRRRMAQNSLRRRRLSNIGRRRRNTSTVTPVQDRGPRRAVDPIRTVTKHSGQGRGGRGGIPSVKPIKGRGPRMIVDPKRPSKPADTTVTKHSGQGRGGRGGIPAVASRGPRMIVDPKRPSTSVPKHSGQGRGGRGGIPDVKAPLQPRQARLANPRGVRPSYYKGGLSATKNAIGSNDYRKTGTTLSVKDNRKKTK